MSYIGHSEGRSPPLRRSERMRTFTERGKTFYADVLIGQIEESRLQLLGMVQDTEAKLSLPDVDMRAMVDRHRAITSVCSKMDNLVEEWLELVDAEEEDVRGCHDRIKEARRTAQQLTARLASATSQPPSVSGSQASSRRSRRSRCSATSSQRLADARQAIALKERLDYLRRESDKMNYIAQRERELQNRRREVELQEQEERQKLDTIKRAMEEDKLLSELRTIEAQQQLDEQGERSTVASFLDSCDAQSPQHRKPNPKISQPQSVVGTPQPRVRKQIGFHEASYETAHHNQRADVNGGHGSNPLSEQEQFLDERYRRHASELNPLAPSFPQEHPRPLKNHRRDEDGGDTQHHVERKPRPDITHHTSQSRDASPTDNLDPWDRDLRSDTSGRSSGSSHVIVDAIAAAVAATRLPVPEPTVFDGDAMAYSAWKSSFDALVGCRGISDTERIHFLRRYVGGPAREAINGYFISRSENAYRDALRVLDDRFGNPFVVADAFRTKLQAWPRVPHRDGPALRSLSDFLVQCEAMSRDTNELKFLNDRDEVSKLSLKLPEQILGRWEREAVTSRKKKGRYPTFQEFVSFVQSESDIINDPIIAASRMAQRKGNANPPVKDNKHPRTHVHMADSIPDDPPPAKCLFCKRPGHEISECRTFIKEEYDKRRDFVFKEGLCFGCLRAGHRMNKCEKRKKCSKCQHQHPTSLHGRPPRQPENPSKDSNRQDEPKPLEVTKKSDDVEDQTSQKELVNTVSHKVGTQLSNLTSMIVPVYLSSALEPEREVLVYALLDTMSDSTFVSKDVVQRLKTTSDRATLRVTTMTDNGVSVQCKRHSGLQVRGFRSKDTIPLPACYDREDIPTNRSHIPLPQTAAKWSHLRELESLIPPMQDCQVGLLIGYDCSQALAPINSVLGREGQPYAIETKLGWSIVGGETRRMESFDAFGISHRVFTQTHSHEGEQTRNTPALVYKTQVTETTTAELVQLMEKDFKDPDAAQQPVSQEDLRFLKIMNENAKQGEDGYYEMPLPFKHGEPRMANNRQAALHRALALRRQFEKRPTYFEHYSTFMQEILKRGDAERVPDDELEVENAWYIPHHGVYHPHKPNKVRVVFDCSARYQGTCLNEHLLQGPDLINSLTGVLCRFRQGPIAFSCDVEKMYHQFRVKPSHRNYLRFLWWDTEDPSKDPVDFRMKVHLFGAVSSPGCANFGLKRLANDYQHIDKRASEFLKQDFYVDDGLKSEHSVTEAVSVLEKARSICEKANLRLHKVISNCTEVTDSIPESERGAAASSNMILEDSDGTSVERTLGLQWSVNEDKFSFRLNLKEAKLTRRGILSTVASIYDPLGLIAPVILPGRLVLQAMCREQLGWDDHIPTSLEPQWMSWINELQHLRHVTVPRCFQPPEFGKATCVELHHFSDASQVGYGQCSYLRLRNEEGRTHCALVMAKARVAPLKPVTIPRLELQAAVLSSIVAAFLDTQLSYENITHHFWTDSKVVLGYIQNESTRFHVYVANRVEKIRQSSKPNQWHYVNTSENPADHSSRGLSVNELSRSNWFSGPSFLWQEEIALDTHSFDVLPEDKEVKRTVLSTTVSDEQPFTFEDASKKFSSLSKLISAFSALTKRCSAQQGSTYTQFQCRQRTERTLIKLIQHEHYGHQDLHSKKHPLSSLDPFLDEDGLLRVGGRLRKSSEEFGIKHPLILPKKAHLSLLIIRQAHEEVSHQGRNMTVNHIRSKGFWIVGCRRLVSTVIKACVTCAKHRGPLCGQKMGNLPEDRVEPAPPFTYCGLDCFGPFIVRDGRKEMKRYGLILTCLASRAIHIEVLDDMTTDAFLNGLRCFIALRGKVRLIRCDQGTNFVGAKNELQDNLTRLSHDVITHKLMDMDCEFQLNPPSASHMGGVWERQIRTVRSVLTGLLDKGTSSRLDTTSLRVIMYEVMAIVNSRPLTVEQLDGSDGPLPLTPNHLLTMKTGIAAPPPPGQFTREDLYLGKRWKRVQFIADQFWTRWKREYLQAIQSRHCWKQQKKNVQQGDIVLLKDDSACRSDWKTARVVETFPGDDGLVRKVKLLTSTALLNRQGLPQQMRSYIERPVHRLVVLIPHSGTSPQDR